MSPLLPLEVPVRLFEFRDLEIEGATVDDIDPALSIIRNIP